MCPRDWRVLVNVVLALSVTSTAGTAAADGSTYWQTHAKQPIAAPASATTVVAATGSASTRLLRRTAKILNSRTGRGVAFACAALLAGGHVAKVVSAVEDPVRTPYKANLWMPALGRRGLYENLLRTAFKKDNHRTRHRVPTSSEEVDYKNEEQTGATPRMALSELIVNERSVGRSQRHYDRVAGYLFVPGLAGYLIAEMGADDSHIQFTVSNLTTGEEIESGEVAIADDGD